MKVLIAGASGAIGKPLARLLNEIKIEVHGITQSEKHAEQLAKQDVFPIVLDVLDQSAVETALNKIKPDIVIDMLTRLPKEYTPEAMQKAAYLDAKIRLEGGAHLLAAAERHGVKRYIAQSTGFWYEYGVGMADENTPFAYESSPGIAAGAKVYDEIEKRVLNSTIEAVILRFGFFYGPGTWFYPDGNMADQVRRQQFPLIGYGEGIWNFIHIEDAAKAIIAGLTCTPGIYNIVNDSPSKMSEWLPAFAHYVGATPPLHLSEKQGREQRGEDAVYYATKLRAASNKKAKREWEFQPRPFEWLVNPL